MLPTTLLLVRHGESQGGDHFCGRVDVPLTPNGLIEAHWAGRALRSVTRIVPIDALYASPLQRARDTAAIMGKAVRRPVRIRSGLVERHFGAWDGRPIVDIPTTELARLWADNRFAPPGGESVAALTRRVSCAVNRMVANHTGATVVMVAHGGVIRALLGSWLGLDIQGMLRLDIGTGRGTLLQRFSDAETRVAGINLPHAAWTDGLRALMPAPGP